MNTVPATTSIKRNRAANVDTDRLVRRRAHLASTTTGVHHDRRIDFVMRAAELHAIENALEDRHIVFDRTTTRHDNLPVRRRGDGS